MKTLIRKIKSLVRFYKQGSKGLSDSFLEQYRFDEYQPEKSNVPNQDS